MTMVSGDMIDRVSARKYFRTSLGQLLVHDVLGRVIYNESLKGEHDMETQIKKSAFTSNGIYYATVTNAYGKVTVAFSIIK